MGALCAYGAEVIGRQIRFSTADHKYKVKAAQVSFYDSRRWKKNPLVSGDTRVPGICGQ